ncbi:MAG: hypothetical protein HFK06_04170 [Clostridia bacterium]|nr:hypothetical protein [Clostridia bacterium]
MKKGKLWALAALCASVVLSAGTAAACNKHTHNYGDWTFSTAPTEDADGTAKRDCIDGDHTEEVPVAKLTDETVWTLSTDPATHDKDGKKTYTSEYGTVEVTIPKGNHTFEGAEWTITQAPTLENGGKAERNCTANDDGKESKDIPALTDGIWTAEVKTAATHTSEGLTVYTSVYGSVNYTTPKLTAHEYGAWVITEKPTLENGGKAERECIAKDHTEENPLPALTDTNFWAYEVITPASHTAIGKAQYVSECGNVEVEIPVGEHTFDGAEWTITQKPDLKTGGKAERKCTANDGGVEAVDIPALTDGTVWTRDEASYIAPTDDKPGRATYNSVYGSITVDLPRLKEPYYNKTYYNFAFGNKAGDKNKALSTQVSWDTANVAIDGEGNGVGTAYPYMGDVSIVTKDFVTNELEITIDGLKYKAYADTATGVIVVIDSSYIFVLTPFTRDVLTDKYDEETDTTTQVLKTHSVSDAKASAWTYINNNGVEATALAITYNYAEGKTLNIFIDADGAVHFGVTFTDMEGNAVPAENCFNNQFVYVKSGEDVIRAFGHDGEKMHELDGLEGVYTDADGNNLYVTGYGVAAMGKADSEPSHLGKYEIVDGKLHATLFDSVYNMEEFYIITLDGTSFTAEKPTVIVTLNYGEFGVDGVLDWNVNMNVPFVLPVPASKDPTKVFVGWYTDAACEHPVELTDGKYIPVDAVTLYAKWGTKVVIYYVLEENGEQVSIDCSEGDVIIDRLDAISFVRLDIENNRYFAGWYYNDGTDLVPLPTNAQLDEENNGLIVYAKWEAIPAYYGEYEGKQMLSAGTLNAATLDIDEKGNLTGFISPNGNEIKIEGKVKNYNKETQILVWNPKSDEGKDYVMWFDAESGLLAIPNELHLTEMPNFPFVLSKNGAIGLNQSFAFNNGAGGETAKTKLVEYENGKLALLYTDKIYNDVSIYNAFGDALTFDTVMASKTLVVKNSSGEAVAAFGAEKDAFNQGGSLSALDAYYGTFDVSGETLKLDGLGNIKWANDKSGTYTFVSSEGDFNTFDVYEVKKTVTIVTEKVENEDGYFEEVEKEVVTYETVAYYLLKLAKTDGATSTFEKPEVTISFDKTTDSNTDANIPAVEAIVVNKNIATTLPAPASTEASIFWGWYTDPKHTNAVTLEDYIPTASVTLYAWWRGKVTVTLDYNYDGAEDGKVEVLPGSVAEVIKLKREGYRFDGWYTDAACTEGNEWDSTKGVEENITIYAKWATPYVYSQQYNVLYISGNDADGSTSFDQRGLITFDEDGFAPKGEYPFSRTDSQISDYDEEAGTLVITSELSYGEANKRHKTFIDNETGLMVVNYNGGDGNFERVFLLVPVSAKSDVVRANFKDSYWNKGATRTISLKVGETVHSVFMHQNHVYFNVSLENSAGEAITADAAYRAETLYVKAADGSAIAKFGYDGTVMNQLDGYEDITYTGGNGDLTVNGVSKVVLDGVEGTYTINKDADYTADAYIGGSYYELTLDKANYAYTLVKRMVGVTYVTEYDSANAVSGEFNKNIAFNLPVLTDETHVFRGWYIDDEAQLLNGEYIPTDNVTLTAKWDIKVTLTVVYGNGLENAILEYGAGDTTAPVEPAFTNGKAFNGWYLDSEFNTPYTPDAITEDTTIYCNWIDAVAMSGSYYGFNLFGAGSKDISATTASSTKLLISPEGTVTGSKSGNVSRDPDYNSETGIFYIVNGSSTYYCVYDAAVGAIGVAYGSNATSFNEDMYLLFNKFIKSGANSATLGAGGNLTGGKLVTITFADDTTVNLFVTSKQIYSGVTWTATNSSGEVTEYTAKDAGNASTIIVRDAEGNVIISRGKDGSTWKDFDEYKGAYTGDLGEMTVNGLGTVTLAGVAEAGKYTIAADGAGYTADVHVNGCYYQVTLDKANGSYTYVKPEAVITFDLSGKGENFTRNQNLTINLDLRGDEISEPVAEGFIFKGWYEGEGGTGSRVWDIKPQTTDPITVYAKWAAAYTVTLVYNDGNADGKLVAEENTTVSLASQKPANDVVDGKYFSGWCQDEELTTPVTSFTITGNTTVYAKWVGAAEYTVDTSGEYGFNHNADKEYYVSTNQGAANTESKMTLTVTADGMLKFSYQSSGESNYDYLYIKVNGTEKASAKGKDNTSGMSVGSEPKADKWEEFSIAVKEGDIIEIIYKKDGSGDRGADTGWVKL